MSKELDLIGLTFGNWEVDTKVSEKTFVCKNKQGEFKIMNENEILRSYVVDDNILTERKNNTKGYSKNRENQYIVRFNYKYLGCRKTEEEARALYLSARIKKPKYILDKQDKQDIKELKEILILHADKFTKNDIEYYTDLINKYTV